MHLLLEIKSAWLLRMEKSYKSFDGRIELFYRNNIIYAVVGNSITVLSENGDVLNSVELDGNPAGVGKVGVLTYDRNTFNCTHC